MQKKIFIDAGIEHIHLRTYERSPENNSEILSNEKILPNNKNLGKLFRQSGVMELISANTNGAKNGVAEIYITGKLSEIVKKNLQRGHSIMPAAVLWSAAKFYLQLEENQNIITIGIIDLSASGYMVICMDKNAGLKDDRLIVNPRCGAGTGINLSRVLEKLDIRRDQVDHILAEYLGENGKEKRKEISIRSDRCGVFSSSATISDKNQGIPLKHALAVTMKSEVIKPCKKMAKGVDKVYLTGGVFRWQFVRDCAIDILQEMGVKEVIYDAEQSVLMTGMKYLTESIGNGNFRNQNSIKLRKSETLIELPAFTSLKKKYEKEGIYTRIPDFAITPVSSEKFITTPTNIGLDIGSTMAKIVITETPGGELLFKNSYDNHGDTIETLKHIFKKLKSRKIDKLKVQNIGITGSGRYQVQKALKAIYPHLEDRISVMVENYTHAWGSIRFAKEHIAKLKNEGVNEINEDFYLLIDIGGEDTKISVISLKKEELFDNAMNIKCSAGTGSLMDTLKALFNIEDIAQAYQMAFEAQKAYGINATCAVFLMENARKMQAEGYDKDEILASCTYAIVENMARSLWNQIEFPRNTLILLHGQTMLSDPLALAVTHRVQEFVGSATYCLVPPFPGHRACIGLIQSFPDKNQAEIEEYASLDALINRSFEKKIIICRGAACGDKNTFCSRTRLISTDANSKISLTMGGCTAVNELQAREKSGVKIKVPDAYKGIWNFVNSKMPKSTDRKRLVIPRSFAVSEKAFFLAEIFQQFGIPVYVDNVQERDIIEGQPLFTLDTCAPNIGATGQFFRLARENHGFILAPQIDFLPIEGESIGRTCTTNQGGILIALHFAKKKYPSARFKLFDISLNRADPGDIADQLFSQFDDIFDYYNVTVSRNEFVNAIIHALAEQEKLQSATAELAADYIEEAIEKKLNISIICAREYILTPGIYDSHVGKLLKEKNVVVIPAYVFDVFSDKQFDYIYWKNPHDLMTKSSAIANKQFHQIIKHPRLKNVIKQIETGIADNLMSVITVSTFRCGPDSITLPVLTEVTKNVPSLLIQSDAMIAELAHLENRVNTHLNQLQKSLHNELNREDESDFSVDLLSKYSLDGLNRETDVVYFPTIGDNRVFASVFRSTGITVIDNFDDFTFDLEKKTKIGRKQVGDTACVPLAAMYADMLQAVMDFYQRKADNDPLVQGKERIVLFMQSGDGPCRQGQYVDICKLNFYKMFGDSVEHFTQSKNGNYPIKFLENVTTELDAEKDFLAELEKWAGIQAFQATTVKGILHSLFIKASSHCQNYEDFQNLEVDFRKLKQTVYDRLEHKIKPNKLCRATVKKVERHFPKLGGVAQYFGYGLYNNNGFRKIFREFGDKWIRNHKTAGSATNGKVNIHAEGEVYLRAAQVEEILKTLIDTLGFNSFNLSYTPIWCYMEYTLQSRIVLEEQAVKMYETKLHGPDLNGEKKDLEKLIAERKSNIRETGTTIHNLRNILAGPLYEAAGLEMPHEMKLIFETAKEVLPKYKPFGELVPYVGETIMQLNNGTDLVLNVAPEGCMVASMGEIMSPKILDLVKNEKARIQHLSSTDGEINDDVIRLSLLKILGPEKYYYGNTSLE